MCVQETLSEVFRRLNAQQKQLQSQQATIQHLNATISQLSLSCNKSAAPGLPTFSTPDFLNSANLHMGPS
jgi:hypothetical protein